MDIVVRAALVFLLLWVVLRVAGKREVAQMSAFEVVVLVTLGDLVGQTVMQEDFSLTGSALAVSTFVLLSVLLSYLAWRFTRLRGLLEGHPVGVLHDGVPDVQTMASERLDRATLLEAARAQGIRSLAEVELTVLEPDGRISFFVRHPDEQPSDS